MKRLAILAVASLAFVLSACKEGDTVNTTSCQPKLWNSAAPVQPACTVAVSISINDTANGVFLPAEMQWKGSFQYDAATRIAYFDGTWNGGNGPHVPLYDDGPWTTGGHEPIGSTANDHILGATVFVHPPATGTDAYGYGLIDHAFGDGWIWRGSNGGFNIAAGQTTAVTATGQTMLPFGTTDLMLTLNTNTLEPATTPWDLTGRIQVKGSAWGWYDMAMVDDGTHGDAVAADGIYTFVLSEYAGAGKQLYHTGLTATGDQPQFVFAFGTGAAYREYKVSSIPPTTGVAAASKASGATTWTSLTVENQAAGDRNTFVTIP
jgi:hypothetical protein